MGGWVAARSSGQQSAGYGRIEALFAGGTVEAPAGTLELLPHPASAAGPDLRQAILGSEGRLGVLTEATLRVAPIPEVEVFPTLFFPDWERALGFTRALARARLPLAMVRTSTPAETWTNLALAGHPRTLAALRRYLSARGAGPGRCMVLLGLVGRRRVAGRHVRRGARDRAPVRRRAGAGDVRAPVAAEPVPDAVPAEHPVGRRLRSGHARDGGRLGPRPGDGGRPRTGHPPRASSTRASRSTPSPTSRMSTRPAAACTRPSSSAWPTTRTSPSRAGGA